MGNTIIVNSTRKRKYGFIAFLFDATMTVVTCGLWLIRIYVRETRNR